MQHLKGSERLNTKINLREVDPNPSFTTYSSHVGVRSSFNLPGLLLIDKQNIPQQGVMRINEVIHEKHLESYSVA